MSMFNKYKVNKLYMLLPGKIWHQIFFLLAFLVTAALLFQGIALIATSKRIIESNVYQNYRIITEHTAGEIEERIRGAENLLKLNADILGLLGNDLWRQETVLIELSLKHPSFENIIALDKFGTVVASSEQDVQEFKYTNEELFLKPLSGKSYISEVSFTKSSIPIVKMSIPIVSRGRVVGVLISDLNIRDLWQLVDSLKFQEKGYAFLIDSKGRIIAHPDKKQVFERKKIKNFDFLIRDKNFFLTESGVVRKEDEGKIYFLTRIGGIQWGLVIQQDRKAVFSYIRLMIFQAWVSIVISIIAAILGSIILSRHVSRPIDELVNATKRLSAGDFNFALKIKRNDEIGKLFFSFNQMIKKLLASRENERLAMIGKAAGAIAHELRNSLLLVNTFVELFPKKHNDKKFVEEFYETIPAEFDSWNEMLRSLMYFDSKNELENTELDVNEVAKNVNSLIKFRMKEKNIKFEMKLHDNLQNIVGDKNKIKQVLLNLLTNALEVTPDGGEIRIHTDLIRNYKILSSDCVYIDVTNTGEKIKDEIRKKIFDPFYTTKEEGLGLGLSISNTIITKHGGRIEVDSDENRTIFKIYLPISNVKKVETYD